MVNESRCQNVIPSEAFVDILLEMTECNTSPQISINKRLDLRALVYHREFKTSSPWLLIPAHTYLEDSNVKRMYI